MNTLTNQELARIFALYLGSEMLFDGIAHTLCGISMDDDCNRLTVIDKEHDDTWFCSASTCSGHFYLN